MVESKFYVEKTQLKTLRILRSSQWCSWVFH